MVAEVVILFPLCWNQIFLVLYILSMKNESMNISKFKLRIVRSIIGKRIESIPFSPK